jgi:hypothetical protein
VWNPETGGAHQTRDAIWMKRMFYEKKNRPNKIITQHDDVMFKAPAIPEAGKGDVAGVKTVAEETENEAAIGETENEPRRSERTSQPTQRLIEEATLHAAKYEVALTQAEIKFYEAMQQFPEGEFAPGEMACVGAGIGGGFVNAKELHVMKCDQAMNGPDKEKWKLAVQEEHERMVTHGAFKSVPKDEVPIGAKVLSSAWAMKKKANGTHRARLNARGYEQIDGEHYDENEKFAPVASGVAIHIVLIMIAMTGWWAELLDVKGAFPCGVFEKGRQMFMAMPQGFEKFCPMNVALLLLKTACGTKQAARAFWNESLKAFCDMKCTRNEADRCLHFV